MCVDCNMMINMTDNYFIYNDDFVVIINIEMVRALVAPHWFVVSPLLLLISPGSVQGLSATAGWGTKARGLDTL